MENCHIHFWLRKTKDFVPPSVREQGPGRQEDPAGGLPSDRANRELEKLMEKFTF